MTLMPEPMPGRLGQLDDPWGIAWRFRNLVRRTSARRGLRFAHGYLRGVRHERPVFVVGAPRSGTTMVFHLLGTGDQLGSLPGEGHDIWRALHHPRLSGWRSDRLAAHEARFGERRFVSARFYAHFDDRRFVEKTPENALRIPYLLELFPDALFVAVRRNPCDVVNSLINGWLDPSGRYRSYFVPQDLRIPGYSHRRRWCFALVDGWRQLASRPVHEIAFAQWDQTTAAVEAGRSQVPPERWMDVWLEDLLERPVDMLTALCRAVDIARDEPVEQKLQELLREPVNAISPPRHEKWRRDNPGAIRELLPRIADAVRGRGYVIDPVSGDFSVDRSVAAPHAPA